LPVSSRRVSMIWDGTSRARVRRRPTTLHLLLWNLEWATPRSPRGRRIRSTVAGLAPDVVCLPEATAAMLPDDGFTIDAHPDYGYGATGERRKVLLWSRSPWSAVDRVGSEAMPGGRFVSGVTEGTRFVGVCVPWRDAHVRTGRRDRAPWEDHRRYLAALHETVRKHLAHPSRSSSSATSTSACPATGNPPTSMPPSSASWPKASPAPRPTTRGWVRGQIDHLFVGAGIEALDVEVLPRVADDGLRLSDHDGLIARLSISP
jgi:hypothetical protein